MQGIIFIYEAQRSARNKLFTVRIEERRRAGPVWASLGRKRCYTARDLQGGGLRFISRDLFQMAFVSETDIRKREGRFYSADQEYTLYRISPYDLKTFLDGCFCSEILCREDGRPIHFNYEAAVVPEIGFQRSKDGYTLILSLNGRPMDAHGFEMAADPVRILSGRHVYELVRGIPVDLVRKVVGGAILPRDEYEKRLADLSRYAGKLDLQPLDGDRKRVVRNAAVTPALDIDARFRFAHLGYRYEGFGWLAMGDPRRVVFDTQKNIELHRDLEAESACRQKLEKHGARFRNRAPGEWFIPEGKRAALIQGLFNAGFRLTVSGAPLVLDLSVSWEIKVVDQQVSVGGAVRHGDLRTDLENLLDAYLSGQLWFDLPDGSRGYIPPHLLRDLKHLDGRGDFKDEEILFDRHDFSFIADLFSNRKNVALDPSFTPYLQLLNASPHPRHQRPSPATLQAVLRPYQRLGFNWLTGLQRFGFGGILADDMGLGKTLQVLALLLDLKARSAGAHLTLLILPKTLIWNWAAEIDTFAPSLNVELRTGPQRGARGLGELAGVDLVITSYGLVRQDIESLSRVAWDLVVLDEAQAIKNPDALISKSVRRLVASNRLALTGTPIENHPLDLWSLFDFLMPGFLGNRAAFQKRYTTESQEALNTLGTLTAPFILRRMKQQVCHELPLKTEVTHYCEFSDAQRACYDELLTTGRQGLAPKTGLESAEEPGSMQILTLLLRLRQAACHPALVAGTGTCGGSSGKLEAVLETALNILAGGHKILIFSQFVAHLELVRERFAQHGIEQHTLYGSTSQRKAVVDRFRRSDSACVFLISLKTGGLGLNLIEAGYVFLLDPWWNPAIENQAIDRSYRIGQKHPVTVYRFITKGSVEENVSRLQERKKQLEAAVLQNGGGIASRLTRQALLKLIE